MCRRRNRHRLGKQKRCVIVRTGTMRPLLASSPNKQKIPVAPAAKSAKWFEAMYCAKEGGD